MNKDNSINRFLKKKSIKHYPATEQASLCGVIVDCDIETGLAKKIDNFIYGGDLKNSN
jgi:calcineurin-like phosphoesterase